MKAQWANRSSLSSRRNGSLPIVPGQCLLMAIKFCEPEGALASLQMPDPDLIEADSCAHLFHSLPRSLWRSQCRSRRRGCAKVSRQTPTGACALSMATSSGNLFETAAQGEFGACEVFSMRI